MARAAVRRARGVGGRAAGGRPARPSCGSPRRRTCSRRASTPGTTAAWRRRRRSLAGEEPFRERRWEILALAQYRGGRQADALASIRTARRMLGNELGLDPGSDLVVLERSILSQDPSLAAERELAGRQRGLPLEGPGVVRRRGPGRVLRARRPRSPRCLARLERHPLLVLTGPSGSGKSSLMLAGLAPALARRGRRGGGVHARCRPRGGMATARLGVPGDPVLLIDQFEETFTLARAGERPGRVAGRARVVRRAAGHRWWSRCGPTSGAPDRVAGLRPAGRARAAPAGRAAPGGRRCARPSRSRPAGPGCAWSTAWSTCWSATPRDKPGALPLLSHALAETWQRRDGGLLTVEGYRRLRRASAARSRASADRLYESLSDAERAQLRRAHAADGQSSAMPANRSARACRPPLSPTTRPAAGSWTGWSRARLVTTDQTSYELAHEALARAWPRLRSWLDESVEEQQLVRHLAASADRVGRARPARQRALPRRPAPGRHRVAVRRRRGPDAAGARVPRRLRRPAPTTLASRTSDRSGTNAGRTVGCASCSPASPRCSSSPPGSARWHSTAAVTPPVSATWPSRRPRRRRTRPSWVARSRSARPTAAWPPCWPCRPSGARPDHLSQSALLASFIASPGFLGYRYLEGDDRLNAAGIPNTQRAVVAGTSSHLGLLSITTGTLTHPFGAPLPRALDYSVLRVSKDGNRVAQLVFTPRDPDRCGNLESLEDRDGRGCSSLVVHDIATGRTAARSGGAALQRRGRGHQRLRGPGGGHGRVRRGPGDL